MLGLLMGLLPVFGFKNATWIGKGNGFLGNFSLDDWQTMSIVLLRLVEQH